MATKPLKGYLLTEPIQRLVAYSQSGPTHARDKSRRATETLTALRPCRDAGHPTETLTVAVTEGGLSLRVRPPVAGARDRTEGRAGEAWLTGPRHRVRDWASPSALDADTRRATTPRAEQAKGGGHRCCRGRSAKGQSSKGSSFRELSKWSLAYVLYGVYNYIACEYATMGLLIAPRAICCNRCLLASRARSPQNCMFIDGCTDL